MSILDEILAQKRGEVARLRAEHGEAALEALARDASPPRGFERALRDGTPPRVIAELKRASPSKGVIRGDADAGAIARAYAGGGAVALSVLTDAPFFQGSLDDLRAARAEVELPVLRKDFTIDPLQILEARAAGADCVLLIMTALSESQLGELLGVARAQGMDALVEVHSRDDLERAIAAGAETIGINNRDLRTLDTDVRVTHELLPHIRGCTVVSESGIEEAETLRSLEAAGVHAFLVGEALMRAPDPGEALKKLREEACPS